MCNGADQSAELANAAADSPPSQEYVPSRELAALRAEQEAIRAMLGRMQAHPGAALPIELLLARMVVPLHPKASSAQKPP